MFNVTTKRTLKTGQRKCSHNDNRHELIDGVELTTQNNDLELKLSNID